MIAYHNVPNQTAGAGYCDPCESQNSTPDWLLRRRAEERASRHIEEKKPAEIMQEVNGEQEKIF